MDIYLIQIVLMSILITQVDAPLGFSPAAAHKLAHPDGEVGTSRAAATNNIPMCLSSWSTCSLEDVVAQSSGNPYAMQVTFVKDYSITQMIIKRAEGMIPVRYLNNLLISHHSVGSYSSWIQSDFCQR